MARQPAPGTRDRILETASRLFHEHGVHAVGMQQIIDECGCGKNLLYREFASKDDLIVTWLQRCRREWEGAIDGAIDLARGDPAGELVAVVRGVAGQIVDPAYRGCPFLNTHAAFRDPDHPAHQVSVEHFDKLRRQLRGMARRTGVADPRGLAERILLIIYGLYATGAARPRKHTGPEAIALAEQTVRAAVP